MLCKETIMKLTFDSLFPKVTIHLRIIPNPMHIVRIWMNFVSGLFCKMIGLVNYTIKEIRKSTKIFFSRIYPKYSTISTWYYENCGNDDDQYVYWQSENFDFVKSLTLTGYSLLKQLILKKIFFKRLIIFIVKQVVRLYNYYKSRRIWKVSVIQVKSTKFPILTINHAIDNMHLWMCKVEKLVITSFNIIRSSKPYKMIRQ